MRYVLVFIAAGLLAAATGARAAEATAQPTEKHALFGGATAAEWSAAECTVTPAADRVRATPASLRWHVPIDYSGGEAAYPIGWPRFSHAIAEGPDRDWSAGDFLHMWVYVGATRATLPSAPVTLGLHTPDRASAYNRALAELKVGQWVEINIPIAQIPRPQDVRLLQFSVSESNYKDGEHLDFYVDDLALVRYARPTLLDFGAENAVMFADTRRVPVRLRLTGVPAGRPTPLACELRSAGKVVARASASATRGAQRLALDLGGNRLPPGTYELTARAAGGPPAAARVRLVESPWK
jgi:hypothetical protein